MKVKDWLIELAENNMVDLLDGEIVILLIKEDEEDDSD
jgi:hypothetical protein